MSINLVIAVTDGDWYETLRQQPDLDEVNFWAPSARNFQALQPGELFLFKLHAPDNFIVGGGVFHRANSIPCSLAWKAFGVANGAENAQEMRSRIAFYRGVDPDDHSDFEIGCRILTQPFFLEKSEWIPVPTSWSPNIVSFKRYNTDETEGLALWNTVNERLGWSMASDMPELPERYGKPQIIRPRLGQGAFRLLVTDTYNRRCAVTRERTLPVLEAAHIRPYSQKGRHEAQNGILLRSDIHKLFDDGYVTVTEDHHFEVSDRIKEDYGNGKIYRALHGCKVEVPEDSSLHPDRTALTWHNENCFRG